jgi:signal transduction histidine kinase
MIPVETRRIPNGLMHSKAERRRWFSLTQKGLALICIPLVFEVLFMAILYRQLREADANLHRESVAREMVVRANELSRSTIDAGTALAAFKVTDNELFRKRFHSIIDLIPVQLESFKKLIDYEPSQINRVQHAEETFLKLSGLLRYVENMEHGFDNDPISIAKSSKLTLQVEALLKELVSDEQAIVEKIRTEQEKSAAKAVISRHSVLVLLTAGVVLNIIIAVALAALYSQGIVSRLAVLLDNTVRLSLSRPLNEPLKDADEISELDRVFHRMARQLTESMEKERKLLEFKQELTQMVSHDLRAPLTSIQGVLNLLSMGALGDISEKAQLRVKAAENDTKRLIGLINELLDLDKLDAGKMVLSLELFRLREAVETSIASLDLVAAQKRIEISLNQEADAAMVGDRARIIQVLVNLLSNAIKFAPENGEVKIAVIDEGQFVMVSIHDDGPGVPEEDQTAIFERFHQLPQMKIEEQAGTGLGLSIARMIVELHQGTIGVDSKPGNGSTFWFRLPKRG